MMTFSFLGAVQAEKVQDRLEIKFQIGGIGNDNPEPAGDVILSPKDALVPPKLKELNVFHQIGVGWDPDATGFMIIVDEGGLNLVFDDDDITYSCSYSFNYNMKTGDAPIKVKETWIIGGYGFIEILAVESLYNIGTEDYYGSGMFVGHGEIMGQMVKLSGEAGAEPPTGPFRIGTVMGWPTP